MAIKVIITGSTGMVGEGVLHESLNHPEVESILVINRRPCEVQHPKLKEIIHKDFLDISAIKDQLTGYDTCYFCSGVSSMGMKEPEYRKVTYDLTMHVAKTLHEINPDLTFMYVSGEGTTGEENGKVMWNRVKSKTENDLLNLFKNAYMLRPGYIQPTKGLKNTYTIYKFFAPFYPLLRTLFASHVCTLQDLGLSMIHAGLNKIENQKLGNREIRAIALQEKAQLNID